MSEFLEPMGISQYRLENFTESKETLLELIRVDPNFLQSHYWLATNYFSTGDFEKAKQEYRESLRVNNAFGPSYYALGIISLTENDLEQATNHLEQAYTLPGDRRTADIRRSRTAPRSWSHPRTRTTRRWRRRRSRTR